MRTALFCIAMSIYDVSGKETPHIGFFFLILFVLFLCMDIYALSNHNKKLEEALAAEKGKSDGNI